MIIAVIHFFRGYLRLKVQGAFLERFLNLCSRKGIYMWNIQRETESAITLSVSIPGFRKMRTAAYKTHTRVHILKKSGLPLFLHRHRRRGAFFAGMLVFALLLGILSSFVWSIEIDDTEKIDKNRIRNALGSCGLNIGVLKYKIDASDIKDSMLTAMPELSWLWVDIRGTRAYVHVREKTISPEIVADDVPCNIVARKDGVVTDIVALNGQPYVKVGDVIQKGELLIGGAMDTKHGNTRLVHAAGKITATTWYEKTGIFPLVIEERIPTGNLKKRFRISFGKQNISLWKSPVFESFDEDICPLELKLFGDLYIPVTLYTHTFREVSVNRKTLPEKEAVAYYGARLYAEMNLPEEEVVNTDYTHILNEDGTISVTCTVTCREEIGMEKEILEGNGFDREIF